MVLAGAQLCVDIAPGERVPLYLLAHLTSLHRQDQLLPGFGIENARSVLQKRLASDLGHEEQILHVLVRQHV